MQRDPRSLKPSWRSCVLYPGVLLPPISPHPTMHLRVFRVNLGAWPECTVVQKQESSRARQGTEHSEARKPKPIRFPTQDSKRWQSLMAQSPSTAGKWPENLIGRNLIETVRKVKAEELRTPTGPEKGQCELSSCSIWCQRPWLLSSTARQFRPP